MLILFITLMIFLTLLPYFNRRSGITNRRGNIFRSTADMEQRIVALNEAKIFLAPYNDIWRDLRLSNKYCSLILEHDGVTIRCVEKVKPYRKLQVVQSFVHTPEELWNMFCLFFSHNKSFNGVVEDCDRLRVSTIVTGGTAPRQPHSPTQAQNKEINQTKELPKNEILSSKEKLDINNCSEIELTELPGISIVLAKKAIKHREEIGGFKSVDDFFKFIKLKPHMENQLRNRIKVEKMKGSIYQKRYQERSIDL